MTLPPKTQLIITSDVHIGSPHCRVEAFLDFLQHLPDEVTLVLNGDTLDQPQQSLQPSHERIIQALRYQAARRPVILIEGNHDGFALEASVSPLQRAEKLLLPGRLIALHGHQIDAVMPAHRHFIRLFRRFHSLRILLGAPDVHVAEYAKRWRLAYRVLVHRQRRNGIQLAREHAVGAIVCGHVHEPEDDCRQDVRYLNTGAWTEKPTYCVRVLPDRIDFLDCTNLAAAKPSSTHASTT